MGSVKYIEKLSEQLSLFKEKTSIPDAAKKLGCNQRTVYRILEDLEESGFVFERDYYGVKLVSVPEWFDHSITEFYFLCHQYQKF